VLDTTGEPIPPPPAPSGRLTPGTGAFVQAGPALPAPPPPWLLSQPLNDPRVRNFTVQFQHHVPGVANIEIPYFTLREVAPPGAGPHIVTGLQLRMQVNGLTFHLLVNIRPYVGAGVLQEGQVNVLPTPEARPSTIINENNEVLPAPTPYNASDTSPFGPRGRRPRVGPSPLVHIHAPDEHPTVATLFDLMREQELLEGPLPPSSRVQHNPQLPPTL